MAWLSGWAKRRKVTIAASDVEASLFSFPVLIRLSTTSGKTSTDVSDIFDDLGSNNLKIAATSSDGETQLYVESVYWDDSGEIAELWISVPSISSSVATELYLYFDNNEPDNTTYVGVVGSIPGKTVWDSNFVLVMHLAETSGSYLDSTFFGNSSASVGVTSRTTTGLITPNCPEVEFDNTDTGIIVLNDTSLQLTDHTLEALINFESFSDDFPKIINRNDGAGGWYGLEQTNLPTEMRHRWASSGLGLGYNDFASSISTGNWDYLAGTINSSTLVEVSYWNDNAPDSYSSVNAPTAGGSTLLRILGDGAQPLDATGDEIRISKIARPQSWIRATHKTMNDNFITWSATEIGGWQHKVNTVSVSPGYKINTVDSIDIAAVDDVTV